MLKEENNILTAFDELNITQKFAIGNDLIFVPDFKASFNRLFRNKAFTEQEISYCEQFEDPILRYASTWAAKEAVYKAVKQIDQSALGPKKIEIFREKTAGRPYVIVLKNLQPLKISLTITHDGDYVWAAAFTSTDL